MGQGVSPLPKVAGIQLENSIKVKIFSSSFDEFMESKGPTAHPQRGETGGQTVSGIDPKSTPEMPPEMNPSGPPESAKEQCISLCFTLTGAPKGPRFCSKYTGTDLKLNPKRTESPGFAQLGARSAPGKLNQLL